MSKGKPAETPGKAAKWSHPPKLYPGMKSFEVQNTTQARACGGSEKAGRNEKHCEEQRDDKVQKGHEVLQRVLEAVDEKHVEAKPGSGSGAIPGTKTSKGGKSGRAKRAPTPQPT